MKKEKIMIFTLALLVGILLGGFVTYEMVKCKDKCNNNVGVSVPKIITITKEKVNLDMEYSCENLIEEENTYRCTLKNGGTDPYNVKSAVLTFKNKQEVVVDEVTVELNKTFEPNEEMTVDFKSKKDLIDVVGLMMRYEQ